MIGLVRERMTKLPRHRRVANPPAMQLTARDKAVVESVYAFRFLRQDQIQALLFPSRWTAQYRLIRLYQHSYLNRLFTAVPFGRGKTVYCLDQRGSDLVAAELGMDREETNWSRKANRVGWQFLEHTLTVNAVRIALLLASRTTGCQIAGWADEGDLKRAHSKATELVYVPGDRGRRQNVAVIADGYFVLRSADKKAHFFLEVDRATIANSRWMRKIRAYNLYYRTGKYQAKYKTRSFRVLTVTSGEKRLSNLKSTTEKAGGEAAFWFTTFERARSENILTAPIWQIAGREGRYSLVGDKAIRNEPVQNLTSGGECGTIDV